MSPETNSTITNMVVVRSVARRDAGEATLRSTSHNIARNAVVSIQLPASDDALDLVAIRDGTMVRVEPIDSAVVTGGCVSITHDREIVDVSWSRKSSAFSLGHRLLSADDLDVRVWSLQTPKWSGGMPTLGAISTIANIVKKESKVRATAWHSTCPEVLAIGYDSAILLYRTATDAQVASRQSAATLLASIDGMCRPSCTLEWSASGHVLAMQAAADAYISIIRFKERDKTTATTEQGQAHTPPMWLEFATSKCATLDGRAPRAIAALPAGICHDGYVVSMDSPLLIGGVATTGADMTEGHTNRFSTEIASATSASVATVAIQRAGAASVGVGGDMTTTAAKAGGNGDDGILDLRGKVGNDTSNGPLLKPGLVLPGLEDLGSRLLSTMTPAQSTTAATLATALAADGTSITGAALAGGAGGKDDGGGGPHRRSVLAALYVTSSDSAWQAPLPLGRGTLVPDALSTFVTRSGVLCVATASGLAHHMDVFVCEPTQGNLPSTWRTVTVSDPANCSFKGLSFINDGDLVGVLGRRQQAPMFMTAPTSVYTMTIDRYRIDPQSTKTRLASSSSERPVAGDASDVGQSSSSSPPLPSSVADLSTGGTRGTVKADDGNDDDDCDANAPVVSTDTVKPSHLATVDWNHKGPIDLMALARPAATARTSSDQASSPPSTSAATAVASPTRRTVAADLVSQVDLTQKGPIDLMALANKLTPPQSISTVTTLPTAPPASSPLKGPAVPPSTNSSSLAAVALAQAAALSQEREAKALRYGTMPTVPAVKGRTPSITEVSNAAVGDSGSGSGGGGSGVGTVVGGITVFPPAIVPSRGNSFNNNVAGVAMAVPTPVVAATTSMGTAMDLDPTAQAIVDAVTKHVDDSISRLERSIVSRLADLTDRVDAIERCKTHMDNDPFANSFRAGNSSGGGGGRVIGGSLRGTPSTGDVNSMFVDMNAGSSTMQILAAEQRQRETLTSPSSSSQRSAPVASPSSGSRYMC